MTGPMLRGSGIEWDLRKKQPYAMYDKMDFDIPVGVNGDCYDRYLVRVEEMRQSNRIIQQCVKWLKANPGPVMLRNFKVVAAAPRRNEGRHGSADPSLQTVHRRLHACRRARPTAAVEAPKGEFGCYLISDGANKPFRVQAARAGLRASVVDGRDRARPHAAGRRGDDRHLRRRVRRDRSVKDRSMKATEPLRRGQGRRSAWSCSTRTRASTSITGSRSFRPTASARR